MRRIFITGASSGIGLAIAAPKNGHNAPTSAEAQR
jgi:NADP-dependent 3-hydroxy acid dehydrogenase YdfG